MLTNRQTLPKPSNRDRIVWALAVKGVGDAEIAQRLRISDDDLALAKLRVQASIAAVSNDIVALAVNEEILSVARGGGVRDAINGALKAERLLVTGSGLVMNPITQTPMSEPDHAMRLEAARTFGKLLKDNQPSGPAVQVNTAINNSNTQNMIVGGGRSFESRRRAAAERRGTESGSGAVAGAVAMADAVMVEDDEIEDEDRVLDGENVDNVDNVDNIELDDPDDMDDIEDDTGDEEDE